MYEPALIKFENTSSGFGFSLNWVILFSLSSPTIPNRVGSSTSHSPKVPIPPFNLCNDNNFPTSHQDENTECGMYSLYAIIQQVKDKLNPMDLKDASKKITDKQMRKFRKIYFNEYKK